MCCSQDHQRYSIQIFSFVSPRLMTIGYEENLIVADVQTLVNQPNCATKNLYEIESLRHAKIYMKQ